MASVITIAVHVRDQAASGIRSLRSSIAGMLTSIGDSMGQMGSRVTQSIGGAMSQGMSNPYVAAGVAALVATVAPAIGALLAAGITLAFGGAFIGLGAFLLKDNPKVKAAWGKTIGDLKTKFTDAAKPLIPVLTHAAGMVAKLGDKFAPHFKQAMDAAAPHLTTFLDRMGTGIEVFGKKAFKPMMTAFNDLLDSIDLTSFFGSLGDSFAYLGKTVSQNKKEIGMLIGIILGIVPIAIRSIAVLAAMWGTNVRGVQLVIGWVKTLIGWIKGIVGKTIPFAQRGAATVVGWVKNIISWVRNMKGKVVALGQRGAATVVGWVRQIRSWISGFKGKVVSLGQRGAAGIVSAVRSVRSWISGFKGKMVSLGVRGVNAAISAVRSLRNWISGLRGKTVNVVAKVTGAAKKLLGFAKGGVVGAAVGGPRGNNVMVGEQGPEMVRLPFGSTVRTNSDTRRLAGAQGGSGGPVQITVMIGGKAVVSEIMDPLKREIRNRGGITVALGS